jgi:2-amino-4-hydroxy-6-hydroxymethyldihydropteridine diphosphokinase/dihydropteroate synthase
MAVYLSLGSNLGDRRDNLRRAIESLGRHEIVVGRVAPVVESPALLPPDAEPGWNLPFLNTVAECRTSLAPESLLTALKRIEQDLGRRDPRRWAPRPIDIDILLFEHLVVRTDRLVIPHPGLATRPFFLTPLAALAPRLVVPGLPRSPLEMSRTRGNGIPLWMGIVNLTPDSFSDGGEAATWDAVEQRIDAMIAAGAHIIDFGAESTRPGATPLTPGQEWDRLGPTLERIVARLGSNPLRPRLSVDTYHPEVARRAIETGIDIVNDVGGLASPGMLELATGSRALFVAMHNLGLPADPGETLPADRSAVDQVEEWLDRRLDEWSSAGLDLARVVFDPGIGFGKNPLQSLELMRGIDRFLAKGLRLLVGHSRKSFMGQFASRDRAERDLVTVGASIALAARGVDILRVHNVEQHASAWRGWAHLQPDD